MIRDVDYTFKVSLSSERFENKEISTAMMDSFKKENVRKIRKRYGYHPVKGVSFTETSLTVSDLLDRLLHGHVFCHCFQPLRFHKNGGFGSGSKTLANFKRAYCIGVDIDKTGYSTPQEYIDRLELKPTFWYTSYSHMKWDEVKKYGGPRFRMVYVFDTPIENQYWFKFISHNLIRTIEEDVKEVVMDKCSESAAQYFNGTNMDTTEGVEYGCSGMIYGIEDIIGDTKPFSDGFVEYLENFCGYEGRDKEHKTGIKRLLERITGESYTYNARSRRFERPYAHISDPIDLIDSFEVEIDNDFLFDDMKEILWFWDNRTVDEFKRIRKWNVYRERYRYIYRLEKHDWSKGYQVVDDGYFSLPFYPYRIKDGQHRRKTLYQRCCLRKYMYPNISKNELIVNYIQDVIRFVDDPDRIIDSKVILSNVVSCLEQSIEDIETKYGELIERYRNLTHPKRGIIRKDRERMTKEFTFQIIDDYYNEAYDINTNYEMMSSVLPFPLSLNYLYEYTKSRGIKNDPSKIDDAKLYALIKPELSGEKNIKAIRALGYKCKKDRVFGLLKEKRECTRA